MNDRDKNNLEFLLSITPETLRAWFDTVSQDDIEYAKELLDRAESTVSAMLLPDTHSIDCTDANQLLSKFTLKGLK